jgi:hypothetical protein
MTPSFTAEGSQVRAIYGDLWSVEEATERLRIIGEIALEHEDDFARASIRRMTDLVWAIREAKGQALSRPVEEVAA